MGNWQLDPYHTQVEFSAKHLGMMTVRGYFDEVSAKADIDPDHPETSSVEVTISTASIRTTNGATTKINRKDFGLNFNMILDGRIVVSDEIQIMIEGELVEQPEAAEATQTASS